MPGPNISRADFTKAIKALDYREREVLKLRYGLGDGYRYTLEEVGHIFKLSRERIRQIEVTARRKIAAHLGESTGFDPSSLSLVTRSVLEDIKELTPYLICHLKDTPSDLQKLPGDVFEHLVAEFLAQRGYKNVAVVGRDPFTAADIFAMQTIDEDGTTVRVFVEVKRWKARVGAEVVDRVYGAMLAERAERGWHLGMIVSLAGFKTMRKYTESVLRMKGIELRGNDHVNKWLAEYRFNEKGLWLPNPYRIKKT